jgi:S-adenosyl-L-methionine hydrolase (adenosine-forming)
MLVTLLTDFGTADAYVAAMKGVILSIAPGAALVDITHDIPPQDVRVAAFRLLTVARFFPTETVHLAIVDPGVGSSRRPIVASAGNQRFVGPDNGLFSFVLERAADARVFHLTDPTVFRHPVSTTFHGRDVFAPAAAALARGARPEELGPEVSDWVRLDPLRPHVLADGSLAAEIIDVDRFGNCITSVHREFLDQPHHDWALEVNGREIRALRSIYSGGETGAPFLIWGSTDFLEISINAASAARSLGFATGQKVLLRRVSGTPDRPDAAAAAPV